MFGFVLLIFIILLFILFAFSNFLKSQKHHCNVLTKKELRQTIETLHAEKSQLSKSLK